jgi:hypothetical protein
VGMEAARACRKRDLLAALRSHLSGYLLPFAWNFWPNSLSLIITLRGSWIIEGVSARSTPQFRPKMLRPPKQSPEF